MGERRVALITGASGFLGGHAVAEFLAHGYDVVAAGRNRAALERIADRHGRDRVRVFAGDLETLGTARFSAEVVVHCAALSTPWGRWRDFESANIAGTAHAYAFARRAGARRFVHVSSPSIYSAARDRIGIREDEFDPRNRLNAYIRSKIAAETLLREQDGEPEVVIIRPRGLIGPGDPSLVPRLLDVHARIGIPLFRGGHNLVDLTPVADAARALRLAAEVGAGTTARSGGGAGTGARSGTGSDAGPVAGPEAGTGTGAAPAAREGIAGEAFNITGGDPRPFRELADLLLAAVGRAPRFRRLNVRATYTAAAALEGACRILPGMPEPPVTRYTITTVAYSQTLDISKARAMLGYEPRVPIEQAIAEYADA